MGAEPDPDEPDPDQTGFSRFYRRSVPRLVLFLRSQGVPMADAADCVQETMIAAFRQWGEITHPYAWCRRVALRRWSRRAGRDACPTDDPERAGAPLVAAGSDIARFEQHHEVLRWLELLPARQRQIMAWTYDGAGPTDIARELGMDVQSVRSSLRKARANLLRLMDIQEGSA